MLKFVVDGPPPLVGLGLSWENLERLKKDAIQFFGSEIGLGEGVFVIAWEHDPQRPFYEGMVGNLACELILLSDEQCQAMRGRGELLRVPLRSKPCEALIFAGQSEEILLAAMKKQGRITPQTPVRGPDVDVARVFHVDLLNRLKLAGGGLGFILITIMLAASSHHGDVDLFVHALMIGTAAVFWGLFYLRSRERIEMDSDGIRRIHPLGPFTLSWSELGSIQTRNDSLGPFEVHLIRQNGVAHKLNRVYDRWEEMIQEMVARARR